MKIGPIKTSLASAVIAAAALMTSIGTTTLSAAPLGVWTYDGFTSAEENEGAGATHSASLTMNHNGEEVFLTLSCYIADKSISMSIGGREKFEQAAQNAIKATMGKISPGESYLDFRIDDQVFSMKSMVFDINGELGFLDDFPANGSAMIALLRGSGAYLDAPGLRLPISLKNSSNAICETLKQCGAFQSYCASTGR